jgi:hypothetical protein
MDRVLAVHPKFVDLGRESIDTDRFRPSTPRREHRQGDGRFRRIEQCE